MSIYLNLGSVIFAAAVLCGLIYSLRESIKTGISPDMVFIFGVIVIPLSALLGRLYALLGNIQTLFSDPKVFFTGWAGGTALYGAAAGCIIAAAIAAKISKTPFSKAVDLLAPGVALAVAIGRWCDFFTGRGFGALAPEKLRFFPVSVYSQSIAGWYYAVFAYESLFCLAIFAFLVRFRGKFKEPGDAALWLVLIYGAGRVLLESMRADSIYVGFVKLSQIVAVLSVIAVLIVFSVREVKARGAKLVDFACWLLSLAFITAGFLSEFYIGANTYGRNLAFIALAMIGLVAVGARFYVRTLGRK